LRSERRDHNGVAKNNQGCTSSAENRDFIWREVLRMRQLNNSICRLLTQPQTLIKDCVKRWQANSNNSCRGDLPSKQWTVWISDRIHVYPSPLSKTSIHHPPQKCLIGINSVKDPFNN
jgi:hypothetical protein